VLLGEICGGSDEPPHPLERESIAGTLGKVAEPRCLSSAGLIAPSPEGEDWHVKSPEDSRFESLNWLEPPHPGPLPRERVRPTPRWIDSIAHRASPASRQLIPSPEGEGQGEGAGFQRPIPTLGAASPVGRDRMLRSGLRLDSRDPRAADVELDGDTPSLPREEHGL
jgi:hypothetical protein